MHTKRKIIGIGLTVAIMIGVGGVSTARTQNQARAKVLGVWEGTDILLGDAEGTVTSFSPRSLEATGVYVKHSVPGEAGTGVKVSLILDGDHMEGTATAELNKLPVQVFLTRKEWLSASR